MDSVDISFRPILPTRFSSEEIQTTLTSEERGQISHLGEYFKQGAETRSRFTDYDISKISALLRNSGRQTWSDVPRFYIVLRRIGKLQILDSLIDEGVTDYWFPFDQRSVPQALQGIARTEFIAAQDSILTATVDLEKDPLKKHQHFKSHDCLPFEVRDTLGKGAGSKVDRVFSPFSSREYARKLFKRSRGPGKNEVRAFKNELGILKRIQHHHCVELVRVIVFWAKESANRTYRLLAIRMQNISESL